ncbi:MAG: 16S rRNA (guanine(966)-N(2))-methyltransferase RsmD [bacterium]|nr:16S rRNA (guanine(966)-N(2))-methyltransferase RsmD [bacterium]
MRIIAGRFKGRKLLAPARGVRPTTDRVKERLFSVLGPFNGDEVVVDLFCGSGGLGIEALSRGAERAIFVDRARDSLRTLNRNLTPVLHDADGVALVAAEIHKQDALGFIRSCWPQGHVHLCFLDPPYGDPKGGECLIELGRLHGPRLGLIAFEGPDVDISIPQGLTEERRLICGETRVTLLKGGDRS